MSLRQSRMQKSNDDIADVSSSGFWYPGLSQNHEHTQLVIKISLTDLSKYTPSNLNYKQKFIFQIH
jgi:hypothetical protein